MSDEVKVSEDAVKKVEAEILEKEQAHRDEEKLRVQKLLEDAEKRGKEEALAKFEEDQRRKKLEEENKKLHERMKLLEEESAKKQQELAKKMEEQLAELRAERKGIAKNDSPFSQTPASVADDTIQLTPEVLQEIDRKSAEMFARTHGFRFT